MRVLVMAGVLGFVFSASAQTGAKDWEKRAEQRALQVGELAQHDLTGEATPHLEVIRGLLTRAQGHLANKDLDALPRLFARIDHMTDWVAVMEERMVQEKNAEALQQEATSAVDEATKAEAERAESQARCDALEAIGL